VTFGPHGALLDGKLSPPELISPVRIGQLTADAQRGNCLAINSFV